MKLQIKLLELGKVAESKMLSVLDDSLVFYKNGKTTITTRSIGYVSQFVGRGKF
jgi:hypothetical protein